MDVGKLSKYRKECMGLSILFIMLCHSDLYLSGEKWSALYGMARSIGQVGVDMFFLLSGLGLYMSFRRTPKPLTFYRKRLLRIIPTFLVVVVLYTVFSTALNIRPLKLSVYYFSVFTFFTQGVLTEWFVAAILTLYILFPLLYLLTERSEKWMWMLFGGVILLSGGIAAYIATHTQTTVGIINEIFIVRIPSFLLGTWLGKRLADGKTKICPIAVMIPVFIVSLAACVINLKINTVCTWWALRLLYLPLAFSGLALASAILDKFVLPRWKKVLTFLGGYTFEIYLWQEKVQEGLRTVCPINFRVTDLEFGSIVLCIASLSVTVIFAALTSLLVGWVMSGFGIPDWIKRRKSQTA